MLMLLSVHMTSVLFLARAGNSALTMELHALTLVARSYALLLIHCECGFFDDSFQDVLASLKG